MKLIINNFLKFTLAAARAVELLLAPLSRAWRYCWAILTSLMTSLLAVVAPMAAVAAVAPAVVAGSPGTVAAGSLGLLAGADPSLCT